MSITLKIIALIGILVFGASFVFTYTTPGFIEVAGKDFIKKEIQERTDEKIENLNLNLSQSDNSLIKFASKIIKKNDNKIGQLKEKLKSNAHLKLAETIAEMTDANCDCRKKYETFIEDSFKFNLTSLETANSYLQDFMKVKYMEVVSKLKMDLRIFTGSNFLVFLFLLLVSFFKPSARTHLFLPSILLVSSTVICSYFYIFNQNWFFTIIYNDYLGWGYLAYLGIVFAFLCDIIFNKARVTTNIINGILHALGSAASLLPC